MIQEYEGTPFARAAESVAAALPRHIVATDADLAKVVIPGWRYDEIAEAVLKMYEKAHARIMPLPVFDIANALGYSPVPYRAYGPRFHKVFLGASADAFTMQFRGGNAVILFNDRRQPTRINYSIMHEVAHNELGHAEPSHLAEKEANYFAGLALCPVDLLEHYGIENPQTIAQLFNVSDEMAVNRIRALHNRRGVRRNDAARRFREYVVTRFRFKEAFQLDLFADVNRTISAVV
ncbi:MAG: ImmA/IrrE family metallo-endopeptidase [Kiritimatiellia bacterium]